MPLSAPISSLRAAADEADSIELLHEQFFAIASHDLQHPISNIYAAQRMLRDSAADPAAVELLDEIERSLDIMQDIVHDYLETAALQAGALDLRLEPVKAAEVLWDALVLHAIAAQKKAITVRITASEGTMLADPRRLGQAVSNLLSNAIKYSPPGSEVTLSTAPQGSRVRLSVQDEGPGIPAAERSRLFRPFGKTSVRPTGGESSTGLGLWIVRQLVTLQDGCAGTEFPPDGGAIFWLELPASAAASPVPASRAARCG